MYSSTCFGRPHAHYQELNNWGSSLWFYRWSVLVAVHVNLVLISTPFEKISYEFCLISESLNPLDFLKCVIRRRFLVLGIYIADVR
jgi:hypothetical protein